LAYAQPGSRACERLLARELAPKIALGALDCAWVITTTAARKRELTHALAQSTGRKAVPGLVMTRAELVWRCASQLVDGVPVLRPAERRVLVATCADTRAKPGLIAALVRTLGELFAVGQGDPESLPPGPLKQALVRYRQRLSALGMRDPESLPGVVAQALGEGRVPVPEMVFVEGAFAARSAELAWLRALGEQASRFYCVAELQGAPDALAPVDLAYEPLIALARSLQLRTFALGGRDDPRATVARALFTRGGERDARVQFEVHAHIESRAEVDGIATAVRETLASGVSPSELVVAFASFDDYAALARERFGRFGFPFEVHRPHRLAASPVVRSAFALCEAVLGGFERLAVERALGSPYVSFGRLDYLRLDRQVRAAGVVGGGGGSAIEREWRGPLKAWAEPPAQGPDLERMRRVRDVDFLARQLPLLGDALERLAKLEGRRAPRKLMRELEGVWSRFGLALVPACAVSPADGDELRRDVAAFARLSALVEETASGLELASNEPIDFAGFVAALRVAVAEDTYAPAAPLVAERVRVVALGDLPLLCFRVLLCGGLSESGLPGAPPPSILLGEAHRQRLGLRGYTDLLRDQRHAFGAAVGAAGQRVRLSLACGDAHHEDAASPFLHELAKHAQVVYIDGDAPFTPAQAYTEERRQQLLAAAEAPALGRAGKSPLESLERVILAERSRESPELSGWDGQLLGQLSPALGEAIAAELAAGFLTEGSSATQVDMFASCPFRYFATRVLSLAPLVDPLAADNTLFGQLVHAIVCDFYRDLRDGDVAGRRLLAGPAAFDLPEQAAEQAWVAAARERMLAVCTQKLAELGPLRPDAFFLDLADRLTSGLVDARQPPGLLLGFLRQEAKALWAHEPVAFELPFGTSRHHLPDGGNRLPELSIAVPGQAPVRLCGSLDRVDRHRTSGGLVVFDYKTGRASIPRRAQIEAGVRYQLPIYLAALVAAGSAAGGSPVAGGYYHMADAADVRRNLVLSDDAFPVADMLERLPGALGHLATAARAGRFHPGHLPEREKGCSYCDVSAVCRVDHDRMYTLSSRPPVGMVMPERLRSDIVKEST
jgi:RecB family exonuclease